MLLAKFLKQNKLTVQELKSILKKNEINVNLRYVKKVPIEWHELVNSTSDNLNSNVADSKRAKSKKVINSMDELGVYSSSQIKPHSKKIKSNKRGPNYFLAFVKFIAPDQSHGFVYKIIDPNKFYGNISKGNHQLSKEFTNIRKDDIVVCSHPSPKSYKVKFDCNNLEGIVTIFKTYTFFTDFKINYDEGIVLKQDISSLNLEDRIQLTPHLNYNKKIEYTFGNLSSISGDNTKSIKIILQKAISSNIITYYQLSIIKWCQDFKLVLLEDSEDLINNYFQIDIKNTKNIPIQKLILKWNLLKPGSLSFEDVYTQNKAFEFISLWVNNEIHESFFNGHLFTLIFDLFEVEKNLETLKNIFNALYLEKNKIIEKYCEVQALDNKGSISKLLTLLNWLDTASSLKLREKIFFTTQKEIQFELSIDKTVDYVPILTNEEQTKYFNKYITNLGDKSIEILSVLIERWELITQKSIKYNLLKDHITKVILFKIWRLRKVSSDFFEDNIMNVLDGLYQISYNKEEASLTNKTIDKISESDFRELPIDFLNEVDIYIKKYCSKLNIEELIDYEYYISFLSLFQTEIAQKEIDNLPLKTIKSIQFSLWIDGKSSHIPIALATKKISSLNSELQSQLISENPKEELYRLLKSANKDINKDAKLKLFQAFCIEIEKILNPIVFDIELRNDEILELAWTGVKTENCTKKEELSTYIECFRKITKDVKNLLIGHNIVDFDCPILEKKGVVFYENKLWDTLLVESLLSPELQTLSLNTSHNAITDSRNTLQLFYNQVSRCVVFSEEETEFCLDYLPELISNSIKILKSKYPITWLDRNFLLEQRNTLFLPQQKQNNLAQELDDVLKLVEENTLIVGPELIMPEMFKVAKLEFHNSKNQSNYKKISDEKIRTISNNKLWIKQVLKSYLNYTKTNYLMPLKGGIAPFVQNRIKNEIDFERILDDGNELSDFNYSCTFIKVSELSNNLDHWKNSLFKNLIIIAPDLISTSNSELITTLNIKNLFNNDFANEVWMHFSGGQSFYEISREQGQKLGVSMISNYSNIWLEKFEFGNYRLYGHHNWEEQLSCLNIKNKIVIEQSTQNLRKDQLFLPKVNNTSKNNSKIVRLNPETIFRKQYWVYQKELIQSISLNGKPIILLVPREEEISSLEHYFASIGYYIPNNKNSISRKIEKLFSTSSKQRILIARINDLKYFAQKNHNESLSFVIDSFSIQCNFHNALGSGYLNDLINKSLEKPSDSEKDEIEEKEHAENDNLQMPSDRLAKDTFFHLKLQKPFIDFIRNILNQYDSNHTLWVLDPRVSDYPDLHKWWNASSKQLSVWKDESRYDDEIKLASIHIHSPEPLKELPISLEKTKEALSNSFLNGNSWYDYQDEYLDKILPSSEDLLVSLPTGAGKSLLFQAPALFKSSFTNKLSIVVTPLKALMEDQVNDLWNKGFINNVEYINSDRKSDIPMIYRSIAGGELSLLYITPERFRSNGFINALKTRIKIDGSLEYAIFDEAHCVSQWGHDFRPDYLNSAKSICTFRKHITEGFPILLFSATVSEKIYNDFNEIFI
jgi:hypothetical protein